MWTILAKGFLYIYTGMVWNVSGVQTFTNSPLGQATDWATNCSVLIERALATKSNTNSLSIITQTVVRITWESNATASYERSVVTNWGATNGTCATNFFTNQYLYGKQKYSEISRYNENNGFEMMATNASWFNLANYGVSPLLWGGDLYSINALSSTVPTVAGSYQVAGQAGRYIYDWETNAWPYYETNVVSITNEGVVTTTTNITTKIPQFNTNNVITNQSGAIIGEVTNLPFSFVTSRLDVVFLNYNPTNQRPNAVTPLMSRDHLLLMDAKLLELIPEYYNDTMANAGSYDDYCVTSGVYWVSNYYVAQNWFEMGDVTYTTNRKYYTTVENPETVYYSVTTNSGAGSSTNYDYMYVSTNSIAGTVGDYDYIEYPVGADYSLFVYYTSADAPITYAEIKAAAPKPGYYYTDGDGLIPEPWGGWWIGPDGPSGGQWTTNVGGGESKVVTNIIASGGEAGTAESNNVTLVSTSDIPSSTYLTNITSGTGVSGSGLAGEIDYYWEELEGSATNYTRRVFIDTTESDTNDYTFTTVSNFTEAGTTSHYNRTTSRTNHDRTFIWAGVSNLLAEYMTPWVVDHTNNSTSGNDDYNDQYLFNHGWSPSYDTGWRLYKDIAYPHGYNYFWDWSETHYWLQNYDYYKANTNSSAPPWHYPRSYSYYWLYPTEEVTMYWEDWYWWIWTGSETWGQEFYYHGDTTTNYYKYQDQDNYVKYSYVTNFVVTEDLYTVRYQVFPSNPPFYSVDSFFSVHSNTLGNTNWLLSSSYLSETQSITSSNTYSVTNEGVISTWTDYGVTNTVVTFTPVYSNDWAISLWGDSFIQRHTAAELLLWTKGSAWLESEMRWDNTTNRSSYAGWESLYVKTNLTSGNYESSIVNRGWNYYQYATYIKKRIRAHRKPGSILDGQIDTYLKFGTVIAGRYDLDGLGYPFGSYVRVNELTIPSGSMYSDWLGNLDFPTFPDYEDFRWKHPHGYTIKNTSVSPIFIFKPEF